MCYWVLVLVLVGQYKRYSASKGALAHFLIDLVMSGTNWAKIGGQQLESMPIEIGNLKI